MVKNFELRVRKGNITFKQIAEELGVHMNTVRYWFNTAEMDQVKFRRVMDAIQRIEDESKVS